MKESDLQETLAAHSEWLRSGKTAGRQASLARKDLRFADLTGVDLTEALLTEANLERATLVGTKLVNADLRKANLMYAEATNADLSNANVSQARLDGIRLDSAVLRDARLEDTSLEDASLRQATLSRLHAPKARFNRSDLTLADLEGATLSDTLFEGATLAQATLREANFDAAKLNRAVMTGADVEGTTFRKADFSDASLISVNLDAAVLDDAIIDDQAPVAAHDEGITLENAKEDGTEQPLRVNATFNNAAAAGSQRQRHLELLRRIDEVRIERRRVDPESQTGIDLQQRLQTLEDQRKVLAQEIRRIEDATARLQASHAGRLQAATVALSRSLSTTNRRVRRLRAWGTSLRVLALAMLAATVAALGPPQAIWSLRLTSATVGGAPVAVMVMLAIAGMLIWFERRNANDLAQRLARRERLEDGIALLQASQFIAQDPVSTNAVIARTFSMVRALLIETHGVDGSQAPAAEER